MSDSIAHSSHIRSERSVAEALLRRTDDLYAEDGYTAPSRGRHENRLYIASGEELDVDHHGAFEDGDPIDGIRAALYRSARQQLATRQLHGLAARTVLPRTVALDRARGIGPELQPEHDDGIDLGW